MSYSTMLEVPHAGQLVEVAEFGNAWGAAARVWSAISGKYLGDEAKWFTCAGDGGSFWKLVSDPRLTRCERIIFAWTFDWMICERDKATELATLMNEFAAAFPVPGKVDHLPAIARTLEEHRESDCVGWCFIQTSVSGDCWDVQDTCESTFHDAANKPKDDDDCSECETCNNYWDERNYSRRFDWSKDKERAVMLFENYGQP